MTISRIEWGLVGYLLHSGRPNILWLAPARSIGPFLARVHSSRWRHRVVINGGGGHLAAAAGGGANMGRQRTFKGTGHRWRWTAATTTYGGYLSEVDSPFEVF